MHNQYSEIVLSSTQRALATFGAAGLNVVPVSVITTENADLILYDFFMDKTVTNIKSNSQVSLVAWDGLTGVQLKGNASYEQEGEAFTSAVSSMQERFPERTLRGIIRFSPIAVYSVSAGPEAGKKLL